MALVFAALYFAPARTTVAIDTAASAAQAEMRLLWGLGPLVRAHALPKAELGKPLAAFHDTARIGHALMTPGIADVSYRALRKLVGLKPRLASLQISLNLADPAQNLVVQTAAQAAMAAAPASMRDTVTISKGETPGAELVGRFDVTASPAKLASIYAELKRSEPAREFRRRLKRKPKAVKRPPSEIRTA
jgi:hypothetical protein